MMKEPAHATGWAIGVDVGGTKVAGGLVNERGEMGRYVRVPMNPRGSAAEGFDAVASVLDALIQERTSDDERFPIGICAPGPLDPRTGIVLNPPNLPCWRNFPLVAEIQQRYGVEARLDNDANAAALAETLWGAGRGYSNVFYACIGTGIGTGIVLDGKIFHGRTGSAAEGGHVSIDFHGPACNCGKKGCIEALASGTAIARRAREALGARGNAGSELLATAKGEVSAIRCEMVGAAAKTGDPIALKILADTMEYLAAWLGNIVDLLEPEVMILGGGVAEMLRPHFADLQCRLKNWCVNTRGNEIPLVPAHYGENSGIAGGAALCRLTN
ncbi:MAG TPA: ROK family protein [Candidatus Eisenbacteria bacterium]|nr:ROK family protein [Candidatus Eisenbacteria bacterium]